MQKKNILQIIPLIFENFSSLNDTYLLYENYLHEFEME